jgi:hypothetical protein
MPDWRQLYAATMVETDASRLESLINETSRAVENRLDDLIRTKTNDDERKEIVIAANALLMLEASCRLFDHRQLIEKLDGASKRGVLANSPHFC